MPNRKSGTYRRDSDSRTGPGATLIIGLDPHRAGALREHLADPGGASVPAVVATDLQRLERVVHPAHHRPVGRRRVRGILLYSRGERDAEALDLLRWLGAIYPRTPAVLCIDSLGEAIRSARERAEFASAAQLDERHGTGGAFRRVMLGTLQLPGRGQVLVLRRNKVGPDVLDACDERIFGPWDERCVALRRWLLEQAAESAPDVKEYHLCTLDAYFDSLAVSELAVARGISHTTLEQNLKEIRALFRVADLDVLRGRWERAWFGQGARTAAVAPWLVGRAQAPKDRKKARPPEPSAFAGETVRKRPAAKRKRRRTNPGQEPE